MAPLDSAFEKVRWANQHFREFNAIRDRFIDGEPYKVQTELGSERREWIKMSAEGFRAIRDGIPAEYVRQSSEDAVEVSLLIDEDVRCFANVVSPIPHVEWAVMLGNILHNLRSALDVLVWELSVKHQADRQAQGLPAQPAPVEPLALGSKWRQVQFPIVTIETDWPGECKRRLKLIDQSLVADFLALQPWYTGKNSGRSPEDEWLAVLQELWNRDKHRGVSFIGANAVLRNIGLFDTQRLRPLDSFVVTPLENAPFGPIEHGTPLGRYRFHSNMAWFGDLVVAVQAHITFNVMFANGSPAEGSSVTDVIESLSDLVTTILRKFLPQLI